MRQRAGFSQRRETMQSLGSETSVSVLVFDPYVIWVLGRLVQILKKEKMMSVLFLFRVSLVVVVVAIGVVVVVVVVE